MFLPSLPAEKKPAAKALLSSIPEPTISLSRVSWEGSRQVPLAKVSTPHPIKTITGHRQVAHEAMERP